MRRLFIARVVLALFLSLTLFVAYQSQGGAALSESAPPPTKDGALFLEGEHTSITLKLFETPESWLLNFTTYYPDDFAVETLESDAGSSVKFFTDYQGQKNPNAFMEVFAFPEKAAEAEIELGITHLVNTYNLTQVEGQRYQWSTTEYASSSAEDHVYLAEGIYNQQHMYILIRYPVEYGDGFGPRAALILNEWQWGQ